MSAIDPGVYKAILRVREARLFDIGCFLMRFLPYMANIGTVTMLTLSGRSFLLAGLVSSTIALSTFIIAPRVSKLVDSYGQSRVVPWAALVSVAGVALLVAMVMLDGPDWTLFAAAVLAGCSPSPQALARARWTYLIRSGRLGSNAPLLRTMFSYEGVLDDVGFMFSPSLSIALASAITPVAGMLFGGIAFAAGAVMLMLSRSTEPVPGWDHGLEASDEGVLDEDVSAKGSPEADALRVGSPEAGAPGTSGSKMAATGIGVHRKSVFRTSSVVRVLFVLMLCVGGFYGVFDTATVSFAEEAGQPTIASVFLMIASFVSMIMGFVFGMIRLRIPQYLQLVFFAALIGCAYGTMALIDSIPVLFAVSTFAAFAYAPFLIVANATCERAVSGDRLTEAITWLNAGSTCGLAFGPTLAGLVIERFGTVASFDFGAIIALAMPVTVAVCFRLLKRNVRSEDELSIVRSSKDAA